MDIQTFKSPDGALVFVVETDDDNDTALGFEGYAWHTHADILPFEDVAFAGAKTVKQFIEALLQDRLIIAVLRNADMVKDVWITDDPASDRRWVADGESIAFRYWSGQPWLG